MGGGTYDSARYRSSVSAMSAAGATFTRSKTARATGKNDYADILNPRKMNNGVRECCFHPDFQDALPIVAMLDLTGSMARVPEDLQKGLPNIIDLLIDKGITDHPNVMVMGFDDEHYCDFAGFQIGQFEYDTDKLIASLNEMIITGNGGGNMGEAYHLAFYALANHTRIECNERDGTKGFAFMVCDEEPYYSGASPLTHGTLPAVAKEIFGDAIEKEINMVDSLKKAAEKFHIFVIRPGQTQHGTNNKITKMWQDLMVAAGLNPENVIEVKETSSIVTHMAAIIGRYCAVDESEMEELLTAKGATGVAEALANTKSLVPVAGMSLVKGTANDVIADVKDQGVARA